MQVAATLLPVFEAPDWVMKTPTDSNAPSAAQRMNRMIMVVMALALGYFAFDKFALAPS